MELDRDKFKALVHYVCWLCKADPSKLGATKLNKILWLSDFLAYYRFDQPITGSRYVKRQWGPVPSWILVAIRELEAEGKVIARDVPFYTKTKREFISLRDPDTDLIGPTDLELVTAVTKYVTQEHTAKSISDESHDHIWQAAADGEDIPYHTIFAIPGQITDDEREWARLQLGIQP